MVFDFPHSVVLAPRVLAPPSVLFTHNVESWIFRRHAEVARNAAMRGIWRNQWRKMERFERAGLRLFANAARRRLGEITGGEEGELLVAAADQAMWEQLITQPERLTGVLAPGFSDAR